MLGKSAIHLTREKFCRGLSTCGHSGPLFFNTTILYYQIPEMSLKKHYSSYVGRWITSELQNSLRPALQSKQGLNHSTETHSQNEGPRSFPYKAACFPNNLFAKPVVCNSGLLSLLSIVCLWYRRRPLGLPSNSWRGNLVIFLPWCGSWALGGYVPTWLSQGRSLTIDHHNHRFCRFPISSPFCKSWGKDQKHGFDFIRHVRLKGDCIHERSDLQHALTGRSPGFLPLHHGLVLGSGRFNSHSVIYPN